MFQNTLRSVRISHGYSMEEVAEYCGVSIETINELEIDPCRITYNLLENIQTFYGVSLDDIFIGSETDCIKHNREIAKVTF